MSDLENKDEKNLRDLLGETGGFFKVPEGYFEELPGKIMSHFEAIPDFEKIPHSNPFSVPEGYFERLPIEISDKISSVVSKPSLSWISGFLRPKIAIPVSLLALMAIGIFFYMSQKKISDPSEKYFSSDDIYKSTYFQDIDEDLLVEMLPSQDFSTAEDNLEQYLIDNNIEISQIEKDL